MKKNDYRLAFSLCAAVLFGATMRPALAEDIDLFVGTSTSASSNPNVLIVIDNSSNWSAANQGWAGGIKQGQAELRAVYNLVNQVSDNINLGLMLMTDGTSGNADGGYVRFHVSQMTAANKAGLQSLIGDSACVNGTESLSGTPKCLFNNFNDPTEKIGTSAADYSRTLFEVFRYFGGYSTPAHAAAADDLGGTPVDTTAGPTATHFGAIRYSGNPDPKIDQRAMDAGKTRYNIPGNSCAKNYVILIGNGFPSADDTNGTLLSGVSGTTSQLSMPTYTTVASGSTVTLGTATSCYASASACQTAATTLFPNYQGFPISSYSCTSQTGSLATTACTTSSGASGQKNYLVKGVLSQVADVPTGLSAVPTSNKTRYADEWAQYLFKTDVNSAAGVQNVQVYTIDVFKDQPDTDQSALLASMAKYGGGKYFQATTENAILDALRKVVIEIQSVNEVFASASLPINATNRSQNENQVFIGLFRPDATAKPRWYGNLKRYQIGLFGTDARLADKDGQEAVDANTSGFMNLCATSFWTTDSGTYWTAPSTPGNCTTSAFDKLSDSPDGPLVEKGGVSEVLRLGNNPPQDRTNATYAVNRSIYTCPSYSSCNFASAPHTFDTTNVSVAALGAADSTEQGTIVNYTLGQDVDAENAVSVTGDTTSKLDVRVTVHGDVTHSRPLPVNYGGTTGVVMFYGANDGMFRAVRGSDGKELWGFVAPEHHSKLKRLRDNSPIIAYPGITGVSPTPLAKDYFFDGSAGLYQNADNSQIWVYPTMRRGGRVVYAFDVTTPTAPRIKWRVGCPNLTDDTGCTSGFTQIGQTWSFPNVAFVKGFSTSTPLVVIGGGYDSCEDSDSSSPSCSSTKGNRVFVINGDTGELVKSFNTDRAVAADVTLIDRDFDGMADHGYVLDTGGNLYRIDFADTGTLVPLASTAWTITKIARTNGAGRKFLFAPAALPAGNQVYLSMTSGDRERPLVTNYPYVTPVTNRAYMFIDRFVTSGLPIDMDGSTLDDVTSGTSCSATLS
ncbi:MAG TPA: PilC/PilY family type IV pilus protein, partial [Burkholderiales bacterium]|nr:PilC/PilY family type IV pilus protein [Burkholderiales bacterium]